MSKSDSHRVTFTGSQGDALAARLDMPLADFWPRPRGYALFAHCFTCSKDIFAASRISAALADRGIAVLRFDFTGLGHSEGEFANTNFTSNVEDLVRAADFLRRTYAPPDILIGHSLGGAAVLAAAGEVPEAAAVATIGAPFDPAHISHLLTGSAAEIEAAGEAEVRIAGRPFRIRRHFLEDIVGHNMRDAIGSLGKALLVFHSPVDQTVGIDNAALIYGAAKHPKSFVSLDDADHLLSRRADAAYVGEVLAAWAGRYLGESTDFAAESPAEAVAAPGEIVVAETGDGRFAQRIRVGRHVLMADEPAAFGGNDTGPSPYDLVLMGLGACTSMTLRMFAERKGWALERVAVTLRHDKIHAEDCASCETKSGKIDRIERRISLDGELDADQRARLMEIADKCPVHRTLHGEVLVETEATG